MSNVSFEPPLYGMCVSHIVILHSPTSEDEYVNLDQAGLQAMPHVIIFNGQRFKYTGVSDGRGRYWQEEK